MEVQNKMWKTNRDVDVDVKRRFPALINEIKTPLMMMTLMMMIVMNVIGDDTQALQDTLSSLCSLNKNGHFGSCCDNYDIGSVTLASSPARNCFISSLESVEGSILASLFEFILII